MGFPLENMNKSVVIVDYGSNNLHSVAHAFEVTGANVRFAVSPKDIMGSDRLVLPGVGAFPDGMRNLTQTGMQDAIVGHVDKGKPLLGICLGMQMLATKGYEFGETNGLNLVPGKVEILPEISIDGARLKRPHIGWVSIFPGPVSSWESTLLKNTKIGSQFYMVHSFHLVPDSFKYQLAVCRYGGHLVTAVIQRDNLIGCQFHPEKSGEVGLRVLQSFLEI
jgi:glutamine amidotransferase